MENIKIGGMMSHFIYEDFYPNAEYDIRMAADSFFTMTMAKNKNISGAGYDFTYVDAENYMDSKGNNIDEAEVIKKISAFLNSFDYFEILTNEIKELLINEDKTDAKLIFEIHYKGCFSNRPEFKSYNGIGYMYLKPCKSGGWNIYNLTLPGLQL